MEIMSKISTRKMGIESAGEYLEVGIKKIMQRNILCIVI
jgi:hypothetical protein